MKYVVFIITAFLFSCGKKDNTIKPQTRNIIEVVYASGNLYPQNEYKVISNATGYLQQTLVKEGDSIQINQPLFVINSANRESESEATSLAYRISEENNRSNSPVINQLNERLASASAKASNDSLTLIRYRNLVTTGAIAQADLDRVQTQYEGSRREVAALKEQIKAQQQTLKLELANARNRFVQAKNNLGDATLRSLLNGRIYEILKQPGDYVHQNETIALIGDSEAPVAR